MIDPKWKGWEYERDPCECPCCCPGRSTVEISFTWTSRPDVSDGTPGKIKICKFCFFSLCLPVDHLEREITKELRSRGIPYRPWDLDGESRIMDSWDLEYNERIPYNRKVLEPFPDAKGKMDHPDGISMLRYSTQEFNPVSLIDKHRTEWIPRAIPLLFGPGSVRAYRILDQIWNRLTLKFTRQRRTERSGEWSRDGEDRGFTQLNMIHDIERLGLHGKIEIPGISGNYPRYLK